MDLNKYIDKRHIKAIEKFNAELQAWADETGDMPPQLSEDVFTSFLPFGTYALRTDGCCMSMTDN